MQDKAADKQGNLLIVDDMTDNLRVLSDMLLEYGYQVRAVKSGMMALIGVKAVPPDLILLDIRMPEMDGYEVCRRLKADPQTSDIPIIFLSASDDKLDKIKALEVGGADYISKPFYVEEVLLRVQHQITIKQLKQKVNEQKQQLEKIAHLLPGFANLENLGEIHTSLLSAITTIMESSDRLEKTTDMTQEQSAALKVIYQNSQTLLSLVNPDFSQS